MYVSVYIIIYDHKEKRRNPNSICVVFSYSQTGWIMIFSDTVVRSLFLKLYGSTDVSVVCKFGTINYSAPAVRCSIMVRSLLFLFGISRDCSKKCCVIFHNVVGFYVVYDVDNGSLLKHWLYFIQCFLIRNIDNRLV